MKSRILALTMLALLTTATAHALVPPTNNHGCRSDSDCASGQTCEIAMSHGFCIGTSGETSRANFDVMVLGYMHERGESVEIDQGNDVEVLVCSVNSEAYTFVGKELASFGAGSKGQVSLSNGQSTSVYFHKSWTAVDVRFNLNDTTHELSYSYANADTDVIRATFDGQDINCELSRASSK